jgi:hypothetical protein
MRLINYVTLVILTIGCHEGQTKQKITLAEGFDNEFTIDTTANFQSGWNAVHGYRYSYPLSFIKQLDSIGQVDSSILYSKDRLTKITFFVEGSIARNKDGNDDTERNSFTRYFESLTQRRHLLTQNSKILKSLSQFNAYDYGYPATFMLLGERESTEYVMQTELSEVPIDGSLTFKSFLMEYPKNQKEVYRPIALKIAGAFGL